VRVTKGLAIVVSLFPFLSLSLAVLPAPSSVGMQVAPARIDLAIKPDDAILKRSLTIQNRGGSATTFTVSAVDLVIVQGVPEVLPANSTPYSSAARTSLNPSTLTLGPGKSGVVKIAFDVSGQKPMLGGLLVVPEQQAGTSDGTSTGGRVGIATTPEALVTVSAGPVDATGELLPSVTLGLEAVSLPLPTLLESGPLIATATLRNTGNTYSRILSSYTFSNLGHAFLTVEAPPTSAMPGQTASTGATTRQRLEAGGQALDTAPWLCVCEVRVSTVAWLADRQTAPVIQKRWVVIFPWRVVSLVALVLILSAVLWRRRLGKG
jgi:hypothetical protein